MAMRKAYAVTAVLALLLPCAASQSLAVVKEHCAQLRTYLKGATGVEKALILHALDECQMDIAKLTPRTVGKMERIAAYVTPALAFAQEGYAAKRNIDWLQHRTRQKNAGQVEFNFATETVITGYLGQGIMARAWRDWRRHRKAANDLHDLITDAVLLPR